MQSTLLSKDGWFLNGIMNADITRQIGGKIWSASWEKNAEKYLKNLRTNFVIISYKEASSMLGISIERMRQLHHLYVFRGGVGKKGSIKVSLRGCYNLHTGRFTGLVKEDVIAFKKIREAYGKSDKRNKEAAK